MRIPDLRTFVVGNPPPHFGGRYFVFLKLVTDAGIEGVGEVYGVPFAPDGYVIPPSAPGLGVELNEDVAARHPYTGQELHLEMLGRPA
jgi:L-alanine-DL-glutamate epimerase-like enolase superfamily enzyme